MVSVGNYRGVVSSRDKIFYVGPSTHTWGYGKFVNARYARFTNSNAKLRLRLRLHLDFLPSLRSGKKPAIRPRAFNRPYINSYPLGHFLGVISYFFGAISISALCLSIVVIVINWSACFSSTAIKN